MEGRACLGERLSGAYVISAEVDTLGGTLLCLGIPNSDKLSGPHAQHQIYPEVPQPLLTTLGSLGPLESGPWVFSLSPLHSGFLRGAHS